MMPARPRRSADAGLTLIEMLVVLAVIGVASGATMLGLNAADRDKRAEAEAVRLARHLSLAVDEALIAGLPLELVWDREGYRFLRWAVVDGAPGWQPAAPPALAERHDLRSPLAMRFANDGDPAPVIIAASGSGPAVTFEIDGSGPAWVVQFDGFTATALPEVGI